MTKLRCAVCDMRGTSRKAMRARCSMRETPSATQAGCKFTTKDERGFPLDER